jgi:hypothetical protein
LAKMSDAVYGTIASVSAPIAQPGAKAALHTETGAVAVDMESHIVANVAAAHGLPMVAIRVIIYPAEHTLPRAVVSICSNGAVDIVALMPSAIGFPAEFPGLLRTRLYALVAGTALVRRRRILQSHIALADGGEALSRKRTEEFARSEYGHAERYLALDSTGGAL